jgi:LPXTG-motif cell wall-anchored protein
MEQGIEQLGKGNTWWLEQQLVKVLKPVTPDPVFVDTLKLKLSRTPTVILETGQKQFWILILGLGLFTGTLAYWLFRRSENNSKEE